MARRLRAWIKADQPDALITSLPEMATLRVFDGKFDCGVDQNSHEVGIVAMQILAGSIHVNERGIPRYCRRILVEGRWVEGSSLP